MMSLSLKKFLAALHQSFSFCINLTTWFKTKCCTSAENGGDGAPSESDHGAEELEHVDEDGLGREVVVGVLLVVLVVVVLGWGRRRPVAAQRVQQVQRDVAARAPARGVAPLLQVGHQCAAQPRLAAHVHPLEQQRGGRVRVPHRPRRHARRTPHHQRLRSNFKFMFRSQFRFRIIDKSEFSC